MKLVEQSTNYPNLDWIASNNFDKLNNYTSDRYMNDTYGYSVSFPKTWLVDTSSTRHWTAQFFGGEMEISIMPQTNRNNVAQHISNLLSLYGRTTKIVEQKTSSIGHLDAACLQLVTEKDKNTVLSTVYMIDFCENVMFIAIDIEEAYRTEILLKRIDYVLRSLHFSL